MTPLKLLGATIVAFLIAIALFNLAPVAHGQSGGSGTINQLSPFTVANGTVRLSSTTANFRIPSLQSLNCVGTDSNGVLQLGTCTGGGGGGGGFPTYIQTNGATQNSGATTTLNFTSNSFVLTESPADTFTFRISTTTLGLLASSISDFVSTVRNSITESITGLTFTAGDLTVDSGYVIPTTTRETNQDTAFGWGNHAGLYDPLGQATSSLALLTASGGITRTANNFAPTTGFNIPLTASTTNWNTFYDTPSTRITAGTNLSWSGNTLNATGGGGGSISTSSIPVAGSLTYWTSPSTVSDVATGTLTETAEGIELSATRGLIGGSSIISLTSGYAVPSTTRLVNHDTAFSWGNHAIQGYLTTVDISANTNLTGGAGLTLTNDDMACDTANSSTFGCLATTDWAIFNNKVSSTSIDTSSELAALVTDETGVGSLVFSGSPVFTGGSTFAGIRVTASSTLGFASSTALTNSGNATLGNATSTTFAVTNLNAISCDVKADTTGSLYCGTDATSAGGTGSNWTIVSGGLRTSTSTDFARASYLLASSTGATSTFSGRVLIGTSTAYATYGLSPLLEIASENLLGDDTPMIMLSSKDSSGGNAEIRFNSPDPDIEFVEIDQATTTGAGKWELEAQGLDFTINSRNGANTSFERNLTISRASTGGQVGLGTQFDTRFNDSKLTIVSTSTLTNVIMVGSTTSSLGEIFRVSRLGSVYQAQNGATTYFGDYGSGNNVRVGEYNASDTDVLALHGASGVVLTGGNVGIGSTTPSKKLSIGGDMALSGGLFDTASTSGTRGMVLQTTGTSTRWVATSTLGLSGAGGGTVTSVDMTVPTGLTISGNPVTTSGTLALSYTAGYSLASTSDFARINTAFASSTALTATTPLQYANNTGVFSILQSTAAQNGYLASTDWNIFNNKVSSSSIDTSSELAALLTDETGSAGSVVFSSSPTFTGGTTFAGIRVTASSTLGFASSTALTNSGNATLGNATATTLGVSTGIDLFGGGQKTTANALCIQLTGSADLCDGSDATGGGGGGSDVNWAFTAGNSFISPATTTNGIIVRASSTIGGGTGATGLTINGNATATRFLAASGDTDTPAFAFASEPGLGFYRNAPGSFEFTSSAGPVMTIDNIGAILNGDVFAQSFTDQVFNTVSDFTGFGLTVDTGALGLDTTGAANGECLKYNSTGPAIDWDTCGGGGGSKWTDGTNFTYLTNSTYDLAIGSTATATAPFWWDVSATTSYIGNGGAGDSVLTFGPTGSEWSMGFDDTNDSFTISSSTILGQFNFMSFTSTSSILVSSSTLVETNHGARMMFNTDGYYGLTQPLDHFVLEGRMRNNDWYEETCYATYSQTAISADGVLPYCPRWWFAEDGTETLTGVASNGFVYNQLGGAVASGGAMVMLNAPAASNWMRLATSTPSFEVTARIGTIAAGASTTYYLIGYQNIVNNSTAMEVEPTAGCFFVASTTQANWRAICKTSASAATNVDTGIASTSVVTGAGNWKVFRIDADGNSATFYIKNGTANMGKVAEIRNNIPGTVALSPTVMWGRTTGTQAIQFDFYNLNLWLRKFVANGS
jgi:hypothetical protein